MTYMTCSLRKLYHTASIFTIIAAVLLVAPLSARAACGFHNISGYVWSYNTGWISLNCNAGGSVDYGLNIDFESGGSTQPVTGYAWSNGLGWLNFQPVGPYPAAPNMAATFARNEGGSPTTTAGVIQGWAKWEALGSNGWMLLGPIDSIDAEDYGISVDADRLFHGWSWNGGDNIDADPELERGDGWVSWDSEDSGGGATIVAYWFETLYGDIYSGGNITAPFSPPSSRYSATYLIQANGTIQPVVITSGPGNDQVVPYISGNFSGGGSALALPDADNAYRGSLGWLDYAGLIAGRHGTVQSSLPAGAIKNIGGGVYRFAGDVAVSTLAGGSSLTFTNGGAGQKGNGTIIIDGNLTVDADISYQSAPVNGNVRELASVAWIVGGNINVSPTVTEMAGIFYSEGETGISTGTTGASPTDVALLVNGMFIAKRINLERLYVNEEHDPSEKIIFDGRTLVNPPPGLTDIAKGLPVINETRPE